ncbi:MAG: ADP-ribosylglycohydrolase family protein [Chloroflexi bacterium]|nr:ADP-ribosylglycohydrolase family protein [Chloroflexota bacterium]
MTTLSLGKFSGALFGLAYGDAISFPALFHRTHLFVERRREFLWRTNRDSARNHILRLTMPFTHRNAPETLEPFPTDDTEYAVFTAQTLLNAREISDTPFSAAWRERIVPISDQVLTGFSERAAIDNFKRGLEPPATGNDNPQHYDDSAVARAVPIGLLCVNEPERAAHIAQLDAEVTNAEDGIYAARAMAVAIAQLTAGENIAAALTHARKEFPNDSWIAHGDQIARKCLHDAASPQDLLLALTQRVINTVYSYGNAAPETLPAAFAIVEMCHGDLQNAVLCANAIPKSADSLPAMVGALCGAYQGVEAISEIWRTQLNTCRGLCLPFVAGVQLDEIVQGLYDSATAYV